ncbi:hypothetical protein V2J91_15490, partial [Pseudomonas alliivorans]|nr:hypothetical protein [Pseudomonas alliivorans]
MRQVSAAAAFMARATLKPIKNGKNAGSLCVWWVAAERPPLADSVEKVALLFGLGQNHSIGQRENTQ